MPLSRGGYRRRRPKPPLFPDAVNSRFLSCVFHICHIFFFICHICLPSLSYVSLIFVFPLCHFCLSYLSYMSARGSYQRRMLNLYSQMLSIPDFLASPFIFVFCHRRNAKLWKEASVERMRLCLECCLCFQWHFGSHDMTFCGFLFLPKTNTTLSHLV